MELKNRKKKRWKGPPIKEIKIGVDGKVETERDRGVGGGAWGAGRKALGRQVTFGQLGDENARDDQGGVDS